MSGFVFGSPVHYAAPCGNIMSFMSRLSYCAGRYLTNKPAASVVSCRRGGATGALDTLNKFYPINGMPMVPSQYWNMVHGSKPEEELARWRKTRDEWLRRLEVGGTAEKETLP